MEQSGEINVGLMGLGVVGGGVANTLLEQSGDIARKVGRPINLKRVLVRDPAKARDTLVPPELLTTNPEDLLFDPEIQILAEVIGGTEPAVRFLKDGLVRRKACGHRQQGSRCQVRPGVDHVGGGTRGKSTV